MVIFTPEKIAPARENGRPQEERVDDVGHRSLIHHRIAWLGAVENDAMGDVTQKSQK
ncbi:hypothetical protein WDZ92_17245 [Nostoc sp. NIES-2111]